MNPNVLIVGLGGIGSNLLELVVPALDGVNWIQISQSWMMMLSITIIWDTNDLLLVMSGNLRWMSYPVDLVHSKCCNSTDCSETNLQVTTRGYDVIVVAVDSMAPRQIVHSSKVDWLDLRCQGDGYIVIDNLTSSQLVKSIPGNDSATSCQIVGAINHQNIEFGFSLCATIGAQWLLQKIRQSHGHKSNTPSFRMGSITNGELGLKGVIN